VKYFIAPHNDDETLFGSFSIQQHSPIVIVVYDGYLQGARGESVTFSNRRLETREAVRILGASVRFLGFDDRTDTDPCRLVSALSEFKDGSMVWYPEVETGGHHQHNLVGKVCREIFRPAVSMRYLTYTSEGKSCSGKEVACSTEEIIRKWKALGCYASQIDIPNCRPHFLRDQREYINDVR